MIRYREILPSARLRTFVNRFWILEHDGRDKAPQRIVPDGRAELILNWGEPFEHFQSGQWHRQPRCFVAGQLDGPLLLRPREAAKMLGIGFHPHAASRLFTAPMPELSGHFTPVNELSSVLSRDLTRALDLPEPIDAIATVEAALLSAEAISGPADRIVAEAVRQITLANRVVDIANLARQLGLSTRQFERRFQAAVGLAPKLFCRIQRFNRVFRLLDQPSGDQPSGDQPSGDQPSGDQPSGDQPSGDQRSGNWVDTAIACGYYDQAHLIRDCKDLSGTTPAALLGKNADLARHFYQHSKVSHSSNTATAGSR